jgi:hypothetical protein
MSPVHAISPVLFQASAIGRMEGPQGLFDYAVVVAAAVVVVLSFILCLKYFLRPDEDAANHIKRRVLRDERPVDVVEGHDKVSAPLFD